MPQIFVLFVLGMLPGAAQTLTLSAADWPAPWQSAALVAQPAVRAFLQDLDARADNVLVIRHAGGERGSRWAEALRDALVALGLPSARIRLMPAAAETDRLILQITYDGKQ